MNRITKKSRESEGRYNIKAPVKRAYRKNKTASQSMHLSTSNYSHKEEEEEDSKYSTQEEEPIDLVEDEEIEQRELKQAKNDRYYMQYKAKKEEENGEMDESSYTHEEEGIEEEEEDSLSEIETDEFLDDYFVDEENMNDEEEWLRAVEKSDDTQATQVVPSPEKIQHTGTSKKETKMKQELNMLKRAESNRRRKAQKDQELDKNRHATIEKLLKGSKGKLSNIQLDSDKPIVSEKELCQQRREELQRRQRDPGIPLIRYCSNLNGTTLSFPTETIITDQSSSTAPSIASSSQWFQHLLTLR